MDVEEADLNARDGDGLTPLLRMTIAERKNKNVLLALVDNQPIPRADKIQVLELAGATVLARQWRQEDDVRRAFAYWKRSVEIRNEGDPIPKVVAIRPFPICPGGPSSGPLWPSWS